MVAKLVVVSGKSAGRSIALKHGKLLIGRAEDCDVRPLGEEVSRRHCAVVAEGDGLTVEDLKSRNGTYVNGVRISAKVTMADGDIVRVGPLELKVSCAVPAAASQLDDVSRWLMADDEPAGMFDTTRTIRASDLVAAASADAVSADAALGDAVFSAGGAPATPEPGLAIGDSSHSSSASVSGIDALIAARAQPGVLPPAMKGTKATNSKDAAAEALKKFFGKR